MRLRHSEAELGGKVHEEREVEVLRLVGGIQFADSGGQEIEHRFIGHRMAQRQIEHFAQKHRYGLLAHVRRGGRRYIEQLGGANGGKPTPTPSLKGREVAR